MSDVYDIDDGEDHGTTISEGGEPINDTSPSSVTRISLLPPERQFKVIRSNIESDMRHSASWRLQCYSDFGFLAGEQLSAEDKALLNALQRPHVVFNRVIAILKAVAGMEINGRHDVQYIPRHNEDTAPNELLSQASMYMAEECDAEDEESQAFQDCSVCGMGWTEERFSYEEESDGKYIEEQVDPREMIWDRNAKKNNLTDARRIARVRRMPLGDAVQIFPGFTRVELDAVWARGTEEQGEIKSIEEKRWREENTTDQDSYDDSNEVTIVHAQWWEREPYWLVGDPDTNQRFELSVAEYRVLALQMKRLGMSFPAVQMMRKVYKQAFLGSIMLRPASAAPIEKQFSWKCITGHFDKTKGTWFGLMKVMRDPQMWANRFLSQTMQIMNTTAKGGILAEDDAFEDQREAEESYAQPDMITWVATGALSGGQKPKIMPKPGAGDPSAYVNLMEFAISSIKDVTGINLELLGMQDQNQPGILEAQRKQAGMTILATLFDSLRRFRKQVGRTRLFYIQTKMSDGRLIRVVGTDGAKAIPLIRDRTWGQYNVVVSDAPTSPNQKEMNWAIMQPLLALFKDQLLASPVLLAKILEYSPLPAKLVDFISQMAQQKEQDPQQKMLQQIQQQLMISGAQAKIRKDATAADLNTAKAMESGAGGQYSQALAQDLMAQQDNAGTKHLMDLLKSFADLKQANSSADLAAAKAHREQVGIKTDVLSAHGARAQAAHDQAGDHQARILDAITALSGLHRDLAAARKDHASAAMTEQMPVPSPAMSSSAMAGGDLGGE